MCSTPFGITAWFTSTKALRAFYPRTCSTPFGITAWFTRAMSRVDWRRTEVLNAFRHHSLVHRMWLRLSVAIWCVLNAFRHHSLVHERRSQYWAPYTWCAQRLSASQLGSLTGTGCLRACPICAQRLSASQLGSHSCVYSTRFSADVLNAFRHHSLVHSFALETTLSGHLCSTPFGITAWFTLPLGRPTPLSTSAQRLSASQLGSRSLLRLLQ